MNILEHREFWLGSCAGMGFCTLAFFVGVHHRGWILRARAWRARRVIESPGCPVGEQAGKAMECWQRGTVMIERGSGRCGQVSRAAVMWCGWRRAVEVRVLFHYEGGGCESLPRGRVRAALADERAGFLSRMGSEHGKEGDAQP